MTRINSRQKGAAGEREAARFLSGLGFTARRAVQNGVTDGRDIVVDDLPNTYFEVKRDNTITFGTKAMTDALRQADDKANGNAACLLWRRDREDWKLTWHDRKWGVVTVHRPEDIRACLKMLDKEGAGDE